MVSIESNRYSVPAHLVGQALTARIHLNHIKLFVDQELVATHVRATGQNERVVIPAHFEEVFTTKPRARVMVYRDWLCGLSEGCMLYVRDLCQKRRDEMTEQITQLYELAQKESRADFFAALELAAEQQMYGAEYLRAILLMPQPSALKRTARMALSAHLPSAPAQPEVERDLAYYEHYVANRESLVPAREPKEEVRG